MKDNPIKESIDRITPQPGAQMRMYHNIRAKAEKKRSPAVWLLPAAACLAVCLLVLLLPKAAPEQRPNVMTGNPVVPMERPEELAPAGLVPELPEDAKLDSCALISGEVARMEFTWKGNSYACLSSAHRDTDFTFVGGNQTEILDVNENITLYHLDGQIWKAEILTEAGRIYLLNEDGADQKNVEELAKLLAE